MSSSLVVPRNRGGPLRTWPLLMVILRISSTHFLQRVRVKIETFSQVAEFFPYKIRKKKYAEGQSRRGFGRFGESVAAGGRNFFLKKYLEILTK